MKCVSESSSWGKKGESIYPRFLSPDIPGLPLQGMDSPLFQSGAFVTTKQFFGCAELRCQKCQRQQAVGPQQGPEKRAVRSHLQETAGKPVWIDSHSIII